MYTLPTDLDLGGAVTRFNANIAALRLLKRLQAEGRHPYDVTEGEREVLAGYTSFGDGEVLRQAWNRTTFQPSPAIRETLEHKEQDILQRCAPTAFYTPPAIIREIWDGLERLGLRDLPRFRVLEPACGTGNFWGAAPAWVREKLDRPVGIEKEPVSAGIAAYLYPEVKTLNMPFEEARLPSGWFDLVIGNVPFADVPMVDPDFEFKKLGACLHDGFFAKAVRLVRPGGIIAFITSRWTLDKKESFLREWLARQCDLLGAFRLPETTFNAAGTEAVSDLIFLRKLEQPVAGEPPDWTKLAKLEVRRNVSIYDYYLKRDVVETHVTQFVMSCYIASRRRYVIGQHAVTSSQYTNQAYTVTPPEEPIETVLRERLRLVLPEQVITQADSSDYKAELTLGQQKALFAPQDERQTAWYEVYLAAKEVLRLEVEPDTDPLELLEARALLGESYDNTVFRWGRLRTKPNLKSLKDAAILPILGALELPDGSKAAVFERRLLRADEAYGQISEPGDALAVCLNRKGTVDMAHIAELCGQSEELCSRALEGKVFRLPSGEWETADKYLSGDVRGKLEEADRAVLIDAAFAGNVAALREVQPKDLGASEITVSLSSKWVPPEIMREFIRSILPRYNGKVRCPGEAMWLIEGCFVSEGSAEATSRWGSQRANALWLLECAMNGKVPEIFDSRDNGTKVKNEKETLLAQAKLQELQEAFSKWLWKDPARVERMVKLYNRRFNRYRRPAFDGSYLTFPGMVAELDGQEFDLRAHQKNFVARFLQSDHEPAAIHPTGAGKTWAICASIVKGVQLGLVRKACIAVPRHLVGQWRDDLLRAYPSIADELLVADEDSLSVSANPRTGQSRRVEFLARVALGHCRIVILSHTQFKSIPLDDDLWNDFIQEQIDELELLMADCDPDQDRISLKELAKQKDRLEAKLREKGQGAKRDDQRLIHWGEIGFDCLAIDEAQAFKNDELITRMTRVAGLRTKGSQRALDMRVKLHDLLARGGRVIYATATPITNTLAEVYVVLRFLQYHALRELGIHHFDGFCGLFTKPYPSVELKPAGDGFRVVQRLAFCNVWELQLLLSQSWDVVKLEDLNLPVPRLAGGKELLVTVEGSEQLKSYVKQLAARMQSIKDRKVTPDIDNPLKVTGDGRKAAMFNGPPGKWLPGVRTKVEVCAERVHDWWLKTTHYRGTQVVFCDLGTPKAQDDKVEDDKESSLTGEEQETESSVYERLRKRLEALGIPREEIAFIHDHASQEAKAELFKGCNSGTVRVLVGSTEKMGTGMNVQERMIALHHLDTPWRPDGIVQRNGRIVRQGNLHFFEEYGGEVHIYVYVTEGSFDSYMWGLQRAKLLMIEQIMAGDTVARTIEDVASDSVLNAAEIQAITSGNPKVIDKVKMENEISRLYRLFQSWMDGRWDNIRRLRDIPERTLFAVKALQQIEASILYRDKHTSTEFFVELRAIGSQELELFNERVPAFERLDLHMKAVEKRWKKRNADTSPEVVGTYRGFTILLMPGWGNEASIRLHSEGTGWIHPKRSDHPVAQWRNLDHELDTLERELDQHIRDYEYAMARRLPVEEELRRGWEHRNRYKSLLLSYRQLMTELDKELEKGDDVAGLKRQDFQDLPAHVDTETPDVPEVQIATHDIARFVELRDAYNSTVQAMRRVRIAESQAADGPTPSIPTAVDVIQTSPSV